MSTRSRSASALALLVILLPVVLAISAYAINVVYMELARTQLQVNTDVATRAAGRTLAVTGDQKQAIAAAKRMMQLNTFVNQRLNVTDNNIVFGASTRTSASERYSFNLSDNPNAVRFETNGKVQVPMLFPTMGVSIDFRPVKQAISTQSELDIALVIDRSGSMAFSSGEVAGNYNPAAAPLGWAFGDPVPPFSRWHDAVSAVDSFLNYLNTTVHDERVALITYSDKASRDEQLTTNYPLLGASLTDISLSFKGGSTNIGDGIAFGSAELGNKSTARPWASRILIVLTDGIWTSGLDPKIAATAAAAEDITIYTLTFQTKPIKRKCRRSQPLVAVCIFTRPMAPNLPKPFAPSPTVYPPC